MKMSIGQAARRLFNMSLILLIALLFSYFAQPAQAYSGAYALDFDGQNDYVVLAQTSTIMGATSDWENNKMVSAWVRPTGSTIAGTGGAALDHIVGDRPRWWGISRGVIGGNDRIWVWNWDGNEDRLGIEYTVGEWVHIALVHGGGVLRAYKNGVEVGSVASGTTQQPPPPAQPIVYLGGMIISATRNYTFQGQIDEVSLWPVARSASEIRATMYRELNGDESGLRAYYRMSDGTGTTLTDDSVNSFNGSLTGPPDWVTSGAFSGPRNSLVFNGVDEYVSLDSNANGIIGASWATTKSAELWVKPTGTSPSVGSAAAGNYLLAAHDGSSGYWGISRADIGGNDKLWVWNQDADAEDLIAIDYTPNEWAHVALVHSGGTLTAYRNGVAVGSVSSGSTAGDGTLYLGGHSSGSYFQGELDEVRFWSDARAAKEIGSDGFQTLLGTEQGLAAYYRFDQDNAADQTVLYDIHAGSHHGILNNMEPAADWLVSTAFTTWTGSESTDYALAENWSAYAAPTTADNVGIYSYSGGNTAAIVSPVNAGNLMVGANATLIIGSGGTLNVANRLLNNGLLEQQQDVSGGVDVHFFNTGSYGGLTINDAAGDDLGNTLVRIYGNQNCTQSSGETVQRCFDISPTNLTGLNATLTFYFDDSELANNTCNATLNAYRWTGVLWNELSSSRDCVSTPRSVTATGVSDFSLFALKNGTPTAITLNRIATGSAGASTTMTLLLALLLLAVSGLTVVWQLRRRTVLH
jgi:hypothetical protein